MSALVLLICVLFIFESSVEAKVLQKCDLVKALDKYGISKEDIPKYVCIARGESEYNTSAVHKGNSDGSTDYGIFQINNRYWCDDQNYLSHNVCNLKCSELVSDDITKGIYCANIIKEQHGFRAWVIWGRDCEGKDLSDYVKDCGI